MVFELCSKNTCEKVYFLLVRFLWSHKENEHKYIKLFLFYCLYQKNEKIKKIRSKPSHMQLPGIADCWACAKKV